METNIYKHLEDIEVSKDRIRDQQDRILDMYNENNPLHKKLLKETVDLMERYDRLAKRYKKLENEL